MRANHARWIVLGALVAGAGATAALWPARTEATGGPPSLAELADRAVLAETEAERDDAILGLRAHGRDGLEALRRNFGGAIAALRRGEEDDPRLRHAIDRVSGQRDGHASGLYWHTDLGAARREAARTGRPILSLRLLGRLDEELSCANSRYFRIVLYSDPAVARTLSEQFVLHWSSERPAPRIEIDMGDGRRIVRTITGNSAHYVLDAQGRPVDAIVGLYAPDHFREVLGEAAGRWRECADDEDRAACLGRAHRSAERAMRVAWGGARGRAPTLPPFAGALRSLPSRDGAGAAPSAAAAMPLTLSKASVETPALNAVRPGDRGARAAPPEPDWNRLAAVRGHGVAPLSAATRALLRLKTGRDDVDDLAVELARSAAADGERNELLFRHAVHGWFAARDASTRDFEALNARVYAELMLTPASDPWLGLRAEGGLYDAVEIAR